jgi:lactate dehydrogenase-like 2-hydroxyacid dehydrogenase
MVTVKSYHRHKRAGSLVVGVLLRADCTLRAALSAAEMGYPAAAISGMLAAIALWHPQQDMRGAGMDTVGFIGLGNMGSGMAGNIQKADYPMVVYDLRAASMQQFTKQGARQAATPAEVARLSDVILTSLPGPKEVEAVATRAQGVLEGIKPG